MTSPLPASDRAILFSAKRYVTLVAEYRMAHRDTRRSLLARLNAVLELCDLEVKAEKSRREGLLRPGIRCFVRDRKPFDCSIDASDAEATRQYYATPPASSLFALSSEDLVLLGDVFEGWAYDKRLDPRAMIELLGWSDGMRILAQAVGEDFVPLPLPEGVKVPILKFIVDRIWKENEK
ncbi:hypothetical protein C2U70_30220 [Bradyrhizobium guangdongense]|uniref:hypothetical protein n=1 Tax=Bradyrhizobium guangdongense TaxID=1325090 RepID=UPI00112CC3C0|nr:hypothetical protein [Bradyrhizobium guangdongense]TPQ27744.1 hypothetical protein C2U70_30220 [Bradyrhizobium guangdongense]